MVYGGFDIEENKTRGNRVVVCRTVGWKPQDFWNNNT